MKKLSLILLLIVYSLASTGMTVNFYYCCGKLKKVELSTRPLECAMKEKHSTGKKCCDKNQVDLKVKADQNIPEGTVPVFKTISLPVSFLTLENLSVATGRFLLVRAYASPPPAPQPLHILHCVYRI